MLNYRLFRRVVSFNTYQHWNLELFLPIGGVCFSLKTCSPSCEAEGTQRYARIPLTWCLHQIDFVLHKLQFPTVWGNYPGLTFFGRIVIHLAHNTTNDIFSNVVDCSSGSSTLPGAGAKGTLICSIISMRDTLLVRWLVIAFSQISAEDFHDFPPLSTSAVNSGIRPLSRCGRTRHRIVPVRLHERFCQFRHGGEMNFCATWPASVLGLRCVSSESTKFHGVEWAWGGFNILWAEFFRVPALWRPGNVSCCHLQVTLFAAKVVNHRRTASAVSCGFSNSRSISLLARSKMRPIASSRTSPEPSIWRNASRTVGCFSTAWKKPLVLLTTLSAASNLGLWISSSTFSQFMSYPSNTQRGFLMLG